MNWLGGVKWEMLAAVFGTIVAALVGYYQIKAALPKPRARLKIDLEILELMGEKHEKYTDIKKQADVLIEDIYARPQNLSKEKRRELRLLQMIFAIFGSGLLFWSFYIVRDGWNWWALLTGYFALAFLINVVYHPVLMKRRVKSCIKASDREAPSSSETT